MKMSTHLIDKPHRLKPQSIIFNQLKKNSKFKDILTFVSIKLLNFYGTIANLVHTPDFATVHIQKAFSNLQIQHPKHLIQVASPFRQHCGH